MKLFEEMDSFYLELGQRRMLKLSTGDVILKKRDWIRKQSTLHCPVVHKTKHVVSRINKRCV